MSSAVTPYPDRLVEGHALTRTFSGRPAVNDLDLTVAAGECLAVFGPNGAGKTTLLRLLAGLLRPDSGSVRVSGRDPRRDPGARAVLGFVGHQTMLYDALTGMENVQLAGVFHGLPDPRGAALAALAGVGADAVATTRVRALSRGMQQRVTLARALVQRPMVVLADEPFTGLDDAGVSHARGALSQVLERGGAVVLVTHNLAEGLALATHAAVLHHGRFVRHDERSRIEPTAYANEYRDLISRAA